MPNDDSVTGLAVRILRDHYGIAATARLLHGELDLNFRVDADGNRYILKIMRPDCDPALVDMQCQALAHLARTCPDLPLQRVVETLQGGFTVVVRDAGQHERIAWLLGYLAGTPLSAVRPRDSDLLRDVGEAVGRLTAGLQDFRHPASERVIPWDLHRAAWIGGDLDHIDDLSRRRIVRHLHADFVANLAPKLAALPRVAIHGDANSDNLLVCPGAEPAVSGIIDFGDMVYGARVCDLAIACAYAMMDARRPVRAAAAVVAGFHRGSPLDDAELALVFPLSLVRLAISVTISARVKHEKPNDPYVTVSEASAWDLLQRLHSYDPRVAELRFRIACGLDPAPRTTRWRRWLAASESALKPVFNPDCGLADAIVVDGSFASTMAGDNPLAFEPRVWDANIAECIRAAGCRAALGWYGEPRAVYTAPGFADPQNPYAPRRTRHLGVDVFLPAGTEVHAPVDATVVSCGYAPQPLDYGGFVILRHAVADDLQFDTVYGHLDPDSISTLAPGRPVAAGAPFARLGAPAVNGGWPPHLHFQAAIETRDYTGTETPPGVARPAEFEALSALYPNPAWLLGLDEARLEWRPPDAQRNLARRRDGFAANLRLSYDTPFQPVRGWKHWLFDIEGRIFLDAYNNVPHVGHCHPRVVAAAHQQMRLLNTNTRYVYDSIASYAERLSGLLPASLQVCFFVNSASEANELALRLARAHTGARDMLVMEHGYHGNTTGALDISPYKFNHLGGPPDWVHVTPQPDVYRGEFGAGDPAPGPKYAARVGETIDALAGTGRRLAGYICEAVPSVGGQVVLPDGFLRDVYARVRDAGGVCISDDVQTGLGRLGRCFWGFEMQDMIPDILVLGKPLGNGHPLAAVVTTREIADSFGRQVEFFSTFGGNAVSCAVGLAVLDVLAEESLQDNALQIGERLLSGLAELQGRHPLIGDVRGSGLFLGLELVNSHQTLEPAKRQAAVIKNRLREERILVGTEGPYDNVLKIRPPMTFDTAAADHLLEVLDAILSENRSQPE